MSDARAEAVLGELGERLQRQGYGVRRVAFFSDAGIMVWRRAKAAGPSGGDVLAGCVFLDPVRLDGTAPALRGGADGWCARVTQHGGRQWLKAADDLSALADAALEALHATCTPPSAEWRQA